MITMFDRRQLLLHVSLLLIFLGFPSLFGCSMSRESQDAEKAKAQQVKEREEKEKKAAFIGHAVEMSQRYNAISDWKETLPRVEVRHIIDLTPEDPGRRTATLHLAPPKITGPPSVPTLYSIEVERVLVRKDHRPMFFNGWIEDVLRKNGDIEVRFQSKDVSNGIQLILDANQSQLENLLRGPRRDLALPEDTMDLFLKPSERRKEAYYAFVAEILSVRKANSARYAFTATGRLLEFIHNDENETTIEGQ